MTFEWPKPPKNEDAEIEHAEQTLQLATQADIVNKRITIPVILEIKPLHGRSNLNIALAHLNIFIAIKRTNSTLKLITKNASIDIVM